jgi:pyruvate, water dikinase
MDDRYVVALGDVGADQVRLVGGKCANLGELTAAGFPVPPGFAVTTRAYEQDDIGDAVAEAYAELGARIGRVDPPVAVRSSAVAEDLPDASFAGVQDTYLWISGIDDVLEHIRRCWASYFNPEAVSYRTEHRIARGGMSVAVQGMIDARVAGVMFTLNPVSGDPSSIAIDASYGLGTTVVGGDVTPDSFLVSKVTREIVRSDIGEKAVECVPDPGGRTIVRAVDDERRARLCLVPEEVAALAELGRRVERHFGRPQDIEWAIDRSLDELFLLQARPETVWSNRRKPVATAENPIAAIAATYLGRNR